MLTSEKNKPQRRRRTVSRQDIASLQDGEELYEALGDDPAYLEVNGPPASTTWTTPLSF